MKTLLALLALSLVGCASTPTPVLPSITVGHYMTFEGHTYFVLPFAITMLRPGDLIVMQQRGAVVVATVGKHRAPDVLELRGLDLTFVDAGNYVGKLILVKHS